MNEVTALLEQGQKSPTTLEDGVQRLWGRQAPGKAWGGGLGGPCIVLPDDLSL